MPLTQSECTLLSDEVHGSSSAAGYSCLMWDLTPRISFYLFCKNDNNTYMTFDMAFSSYFMHIL